MLRLPITKHHTAERMSFFERSRVVAIRRTWRKQLVAIAGVLTLTIGSAGAQGCSPPAGMGIQQWYSICAPALQQTYAQGMGGNLSFDGYVQSMYQVYAQPVRQAMPQYSGGGMQCNIGQTQCFSGYLRQCQPMPTGGSWWITGAQRC